MKTLPAIKPTAEQLPLIGSNSLGAEVIRGAAGSGKTSTAILRLRSLAYFFESRRDREARNDPVHILVLTFNRTLSGYVQNLVDEQVQANPDTVTKVDTFARWAMEHLNYPAVVKDKVRERKLRELATPITQLAANYLIKEVDYLLGRFMPDNLENYITVERTGRGTEPRVDRSLRRRIIDEVVKPYQLWLKNRNELDWNDLAVKMVNHPVKLAYDVVAVDESQDFSANQLRAIKAHLAEEHAVTFVIDTIQRIYARGFTWVETGFVIGPGRSFELKENHRNTKQIASFARAVLDGIPADADGSLPNLDAASKIGSLPSVIVGKFSEQAEWAIKFIRSNVDLTATSVAFLHPKGGRYFNFLKRKLARAGFDFIDLTRNSEWPAGNENVALSTFHSAKGLEFDHVFILGLSEDATAHSDAAVDDQLAVLRRLFAVAIARATTTVTVGYKSEEKSKLVDFLKDGTFEEVTL